MAHYGANFEIYRAFTLIPASHLVIPAKAGIHLRVPCVPCGEPSYPLSRRGREPAPYLIRGLG